MNMKRFLALVNPSIPFGKALNGLAHLSMGIGHWIPLGKMPTIEIVFADQKILRLFRQEASKIAQAHFQEAIFSDFTNTMTVGPLENCLKMTEETCEKDLIYYAASLCTEEKWLQSPELDLLLKRSKRLKDYEPSTPSVENGSFEFKSITELPPYHDLPLGKISLILERKQSLATLVNAAVIASLSVGMQTDPSLIKLVNYVDADHQKHPYISCHPFPILAARPQSKFTELMYQIERDSNLLINAVKDSSGNGVAICLLGTEEQVNAYTRQKFISLWTSDLPEDAFSI
jgi:hypothetical protein